MSAAPVYESSEVDAVSPLEHTGQHRVARADRRRDAANGLLEPPMRFRALQATLKMETDFLELADKKARFALIIMSVLNAVALVLVVRGGDSLLPRAGVWGAVLQVEFATYGAVTVYYVWQAIESLRPRGKMGRPSGTLPSEIVPGASMRVLFHTDIAARPRDAYRAMWSTMRLDNVNAELADQVHLVSSINVKKYDALTRLYFGVAVMTGMIALVLLTIGAHHVVVGAAGAAAAVRPT